MPSLRARLGSIIERATSDKIEVDENPKTGLLHIDQRANERASLELRMELTLAQVEAIHAQTRSAERQTRALVVATVALAVFGALQVVVLVATALYPHLWRP